MVERPFRRRVGWTACLLSCIVLGGLAPARGVSEPDPIPQALDQYSHGQFESAVVALTARADYRELLRRYADRAAGWTASAPPGERPRRQHIGIALATELVAESVDGTFTDYTRARPLIEWACNHLGRQAPSEFERWVHLASVAILDGAGDQDLLGTMDRSAPRQGHLHHAATRFPDDDRFQLARVIARREARIISARPISPSTLLGLGAYAIAERGAPRLQDTFKLLSELDGPLVRDEARLRRGVLRFLIGQTGEAWQDLALASDSTDPFVAFLANMALGAIYDRTGEDAAAVARYSRAVRITAATSAELGLAAALFRQGRADEAADLTTRWVGGIRVEDPGRIYGLGMFHYLPSYLTSMREASR